MAESMADPHGPTDVPQSSSTSRNSRPRVSLRLVDPGVRRPPEQRPDSPFAPLLPPRRLDILLDAIDGELVDRVDARVELKLRGGRYAAHLFNRGMLPVVIEPETQAVAQMVAERCVEGGLSHTRITGAEVTFKQPLRLHHILPVLVKLPSLFQDHRVAALLARAERLSNTQVAGMELGALGHKLTRALSGRLEGWLSRRQGIARRLTQLQRSVHGGAEDLAYVDLTRATARSVWRGGAWQLELRFSGVFGIATPKRGGGAEPLSGVDDSPEGTEHLKFDFHDVHVPQALIPAPHAVIDRLFSKAPLATAAIRPGRLLIEQLTEEITRAISTFEGEMDLRASLPDLGLQVSMPDQGRLTVESALTPPVRVHAHFAGQLSERRLSVRMREITVGRPTQALTLEADFELHATDTQGDLPRHALVKRLTAAAQAERWPDIGLVARLGATIRPGGRLAGLQMRAALGHDALRGGSAIHLAVCDLAIEGAAAVVQGERGGPEVTLDWAYEAQVSLREGSHFDDGQTHLRLDGTEATIKGRARFDQESQLDLTAHVAGPLKVNGRTQVEGLPELSIDDGTLSTHLDGTMELHARLRSRRGTDTPGADAVGADGLIELDFSDTQASLILERGELALPPRRLLLPQGTRFEAKLRDAVLSASGLGRARINVAWDMLGRSPQLICGPDTVEIFVEALRKTRFELNLSPTGGLAITGEDGGLYDARYFNALVNPGAEPMRLLELFENDEAMDRVLAVLALFSTDARDFVDRLRSVAKRGRRAMDTHAISEPRDLLPAPQIASMVSSLLEESVERASKLVDRVFPLVKRVTDGRGLDVMATKRLLHEIFGDHEYDYEVDRVVRWLGRLLAPAEPMHPQHLQELLPLAETPAYRDLLRRLPSAGDLYRTVAADSPQPPDFAHRLVAIAPLLTLRQLEYLLGQPRTDWPAAPRARLQQIIEVKRRVWRIAESYGGLAFAPQALAIAFFLGETLAMGRGVEPVSPNLPLPYSQTLLGPADTAVLLQAGLAAVLPSRAVQLNQRMLLEHALDQPSAYVRAVLIELSGRSPRVLSSVLNALLDMDQDQLRTPLDLVALLTTRLGIELPRRRDYLAGGRWARASYYEALNRAAHQILSEAEPYLAIRGHLQVERRSLYRPPLRTVRISEQSQVAQAAIENADAIAREIDFSRHTPESATAAADAYQRAWSACVQLIELDSHTFQTDWMKAFWARTYEALVVHSVVRNVQQDVDNVRRWLEVRLGRPHRSGEQALLDDVLDVLYFFEPDQAGMRSDPLVRLLIDPPEIHYDFSVVSCMGVITEGEAGRELEDAYQRLAARRGIHTIRANTATARSLEYNADRVEEAARRATTPWGYIGYSQGCTNGLQCEANLMGGTPDQQALADRLRCRNLLFSALNGSAHGTCGDQKMLRAMIDGERFLKHYQATFSNRAIELALKNLRHLLDSRPMVHGLLGSASLSHDGVRFLHREGQFKPDAPTSIVRGVVRRQWLPEALEWLSNVLERQIENDAHDTQVVINEAVGHPVWVANPQAAVLARCDMGCRVQSTHHWSPLTHEIEFVETERDRELAVYDSPKDRHVFPWIDVNARFGIIKAKAP